MSEAQSIPSPIAEFAELVELGAFVNTEPSANWRPGQRARHRKSVSHTIRHGVRSILRSVVRRDDFDLPNLRELVELRAELDEAIGDAVANLRRQSHSWAAIGRELGTTRQAAQMRYGDRPDTSSGE